ncbi:MAG: GIY-YIG nuclease family protein [Patescibacteria group bacterium]|nr:GIY-YIG nuclease family protein [Patescibacteria group bacterium]
MKGYVYILTNKPRGTLYIGVTSNLDERLAQHDSTEEKSFTKKYKLKKLVYFEECNSIKDAIAREKQMKNWHREWKISQIETINPEWRDLIRS